MKFTESLGKSVGPPKRRLEGQRYGRLLAVSPTNKRDSAGNVFWLCQCDCGKTKEVTTQHLLKGETKSCGCLSKELSSVRCVSQFTTHGMSATKEWWQLARARRRARKYGTGLKPIGANELKKRAEMFENKCIYCGAPYEEMDHYIPLVRGGEHSIENLYPSCTSCNRKKNSKIPVFEWMPDVFRIINVLKGKL